MDILARCYDRVIVQVGTHGVAEVPLGGGVRDENRVLLGNPTIGEVTQLEEPAGSLAVFRCDRCSNYGPRGTPPGGASAFQQFALLHGAYPWNGNQPGWYCMGCSMPPH